MGTFKFRAGNAIFARGMRQWHRLEGTKILTKTLPGTRNNQDVKDAQRGKVGGNDYDDYDNNNHYSKNQRGRRGGGGRPER